MKRRRLVPVVLALAVATTLSACAGGSAGTESPAGTIVVSEGSSRFQGSELDPPLTLPDVRLTRTDGTEVDFRDATSPVTVVFFGYTNCPDVCNTQMAEVASALRRMDEDKRDQVGVVFVTTDPDRDDPRTLREYLDRFDVELGTDFEGLTGPMPTIRTAADALKVAITGRTKVPGGYEVGHGSQLIGVNRDGEAVVVWTVGTAVGDLRADLTALVDEASA